MPNVAIVTGAAGALGSEVSKRLASLGYGVALIDTPRGVERIRALASTLGDSVLAVEGAVADQASWRAALASIESKLGPVTHAALIAGGWQGGTPLHQEADDTAWRAMLDTNLDQAHTALRALLSRMVERKLGSIVAIGSQAVERPWTAVGASAYATSKSALTALCRVAAQEVLEHNVRINVVLPSTLDTAANRAAMPNTDPARWVTTESAAGVIAFLLSDASRDISGAVIPLYGRA